MENKKELRNWLDAFNLDHPLVIAGPCSAETEKQVLTIAHQLKKSDATVFRAGIWKPRTRPGNFEGVGALFGYLGPLQCALSTHVQTVWSCWTGNPWSSVLP